MYIDSRIQLFDSIAWTDIATHTYERVSRTRWRVKIRLVCGAEMILENIPDDLIQCLVVGAFNSGKSFDTNITSGVAMDKARFPNPAGTWSEIQNVILAGAAQVSS